MSREGHKNLQERVCSAAQAALADHDHVSAVDVLLRIGWLDAASHKRWQTGQIPCLEAGTQTRPARIAEAMQLFRDWALKNRLRPSEVSYVARTPGNEALRFTESGDDELERAYRTHWFAPDLPERRRQQLEQKANQRPELVVIQSSRDWTCHRCGGSGGFLVMEPPGPACLTCIGLGHLELLPSGNAALSRRAKAKSSVHAVVVRFSRTRKRYERQGILVEAEALRSAEAELQGADPGPERRH